MCKATLDFVEHQQSASLASLLQGRPAQRLQHCVDTQDFPEPVEEEVCCSLVVCGSTCASRKHFIQPAYRPLKI